ncbi:MAG: FMN-binding protein [Clostridia bacterium]|nr:FMN-binding protein [Clostridia bacterium]
MADSVETKVEEVTPQAEVQETKPAKKKDNKGIMDIVKCALVLVVIALVAGAVLGAVNMVTYVDPDGVIKDQVAGVYGVTADSVEKLSEDAIVNKDGLQSLVKAIYKTDEGYCFYSAGAHSKGGTIELLVYIDKDGIIKDVTCYSESETAGYYKKVEKANKDKYIGLNVKDSVPAMKGSKSDFADGTEFIDAVSQATYTSSGYHNAVAAAAYAYQHIN